MQQAKPIGHWDSLFESLGCVKFRVKTTRHTQTKQNKTRNVKPKFGSRSDSNLMFSYGDWNPASHIILITELGSFCSSNSIPITEAFCRGKKFMSEAAKYEEIGDANIKLGPMDRQAWANLWGKAARCFWLDKRWLEAKCSVVYIGSNQTLWLFIAHMFGSILGFITCLRKWKP